MKLTEEEKEVILALRAQKELEKPIKQGFAKENMYDISEFKKFYTNYLPRIHWFLTESQKQELKQKLLNMLETWSPILKKGDKFDCYLEDGEEGWYDASSRAFEGVESEFMEQYLENIKDLRVKRKV